VNHADEQTGTRQRPANSVRLLVRFIVAFLFWTAIGVFFATQLRSAGMSWRQALEWSLPRWYSWAIVTPFIFRSDRWMVGRWRLAGRLVSHVPLAVAWTSITILLRLIARPLRGASLPPDISVFFFDRFYPDLAIYTVIAVVSMLRAYTEHIRLQELAARELAADLERRLAEARLQTLRAQLQPHFLFNALNTISAFTETDPRVARRLMEQLGDLLRASLTHTAQPLVTLGEELTFLDDYLAIESARFEGRIQVSVNVDDDLIDRHVPSFLFQPLVENAIRHGVAPRLSGGRIEVSATIEGARLMLRVRDNGLGLPLHWTFDQHAGVGLRNLTARLDAIYRRSDLVRITPIESGGVEVVVQIPTPQTQSDPMPAERREREAIAANPRTHRRR
jgi:two-component system, LytTR family, sensor kinase